MDKISYLWLYGLACLLSLTNCRKPATSSLQHEFGNTSVRPISQLFNCRQGSTVTQQQDAEFPKTTAYLKQVAGHIMNLNPHTFKGPYSPENFCFHTVYVPHFNAFAIPNAREVAFHTGAMVTFQSDAGVAAVMAHELAHVTMQHQGHLTHADFLQVKDQNPDIANQQANTIHSQEEFQQASMRYAALAQEVYRMMDAITYTGEDAKEAVQTIRALEATIFENQHIQNMSPSHWQKLADQLTQAYDRLTGVFDAENGVAIVAKWGEMRRLEEQINQTAQAMGSNQQAVAQSATPVVGPEQTANGTEREADEVGYELYLRARMVPQSYTGMINNLIQLGGQSWLARNFGAVECIKNMLISFGRSPDRGTQSHPTGCWRLFNIASNENAAHKEDYRDLMAAATLTSIPGAVTLQEVHDEIRNYNPHAQTPSDDFIKSRRELCTNMGGTWIEDAKFCSLPPQMTIEEEKAHCAQFRGFWHDKCKCLPAEWSDKDIDETQCVPKDFLQQQEQQGQQGQGQSPQNNPEGQGSPAFAPEDQGTFDPYEDPYTEMYEDPYAQPYEDPYSNSF